MIACHERNCYTAWGRQEYQRSTSGWCRTYMRTERRRVVKSVVGVTDGLKVGDQALALSPLLFAVVMDGLTDEVMQNSLLRL